MGNLTKKEAEDIKLGRLIAARKKLVDAVDAINDAAKEKAAPLKARQTQIEEQVKEMLLARKADGQASSHKTEGYMGYIAKSTKYNLNKGSRQDLETWVMDSVNLVLAECEGGSVDADQLADAVAEVHDRMTIFSNSVVKDVVEDYRKRTGGKEVEGALTGGRLPDGVVLFTEDKVNFRKA